MLATNDPPQRSTLDPFHEAIVDAVCAADAARVARTGHGHTRLAVAHEFCRPGEPCWTWPTVVTVTPIASGVRLRHPFAGMVVA